MLYFSKTIFIFNKKIPNLSKKDQIIATW